jgi:predicted phage terminase large subunit-like protein
MLMALPLIERERLLMGNWKIRPTAGKVFNRAWFGLLKTLPTDVVEWTRYWDKAGTEDGGAFSAGVLMGKRENGRFVIADVVRGQWSSMNRENVITQVTCLDHERHGNVDIWVEQEPGSGGKESAENTVRRLAGFNVRAERVTGDKLTRAMPLSAQAEATNGHGNVDLVVGPWNEAFLVEAQNFDGISGYCDQIDAASGAFNKLTLGPRPVRTRRLAWG